MKSFKNNNSQFPNSIVITLKDNDGNKYFEDALTLYKEFISEEYFIEDEWNNIDVDWWNEFVLHGSTYLVISIKTL